MGKLFSIAFIVAFSVAACAAPPKDFTPELYRSKDRTESVTLIAPDRAARLANGKTNVGTYTRDKDALRITLSAQGTKFTTVYQFTKEGLVSQHGKVLFDAKKDLDLGDISQETLRRLPPPVFPAGSRTTDRTGKITVRVTVNDKGAISSVKVLESSGQKVLDDDAVAWLRQNSRFPSGNPGTFTHVVHFNIKSENFVPDPGNDVVSITKANEKNFPFPPYPAHLREKGMRGKIMLGMAVNARGEVVATKVLESSGHPELDNHTINWVKTHWKFPPGEPRALRKGFRYELKDARGKDIY